MIEVLWIEIYPHSLTPGSAFAQVFQIVNIFIMQLTPDV